jgi:predicted enzyme related to lactoylglutathione lyase
MHHSRLRGFIIDCKTDDLAGAAAFWAAALGDEKRRQPQGKYVKLDRQAGLVVEVQKVAHPSRVHLDIASDDIAAEVARLERLGGRPVKALKNWTVMEAPTGHRFCVVRAKGRDFAATANAWEDTHALP